MSRLAPGRYLGMREWDLANKPYARFWNPVMRPLPEHVREALAQGPVAEPLLPALPGAARVMESPSGGLENGFCLTRDGAMHLALNTELPGVSPAMIDWWFGWHSEEPQRYKLWHPRAHVHAHWQSGELPGRRGRERYVGRTSYVDEYIGSEVGGYLIRFVPPVELGFDPARLVDPSRATAVCARVGFGAAPCDFGYLAHYVAATPGGAVMRSRFWIAGRYAAARAGGWLGSAAVAVARRVLRPKVQDARDLLVHCAQEMSHLGSFLPELFRELGET